MIGGLLAAPHAAHAYSPRTGEPRHSLPDFLNHPAKDSVGFSLHTQQRSPGLKLTFIGSFAVGRRLWALRMVLVHLNTVGSLKEVAAQRRLVGDKMTQSGLLSAIDVLTESYEQLDFTVQRTQMGMGVVMDSASNVIVELESGRCCHQPSQPSPSGPPPALTMLSHPYATHPIPYASDPIPPRPAPSRPVPSQSRSTGAESGLREGDAVMMVDHIVVTAIENGMVVPRSAVTAVIDPMKTQLTFTVFRPKDL